MDLDEEDYELLGVARPLVFEEAFQIEARVRALDAIPKRRRKPTTAAQKFLAARRRRAAYVPRERKPRTRKEPWEKRNPEKNRERKLKWYYAHKDEVLKYQAEWRAKNPNYMKDYAAKRRREKKR